MTDIDLVDSPSEEPEPEEPMPLEDMCFSFVAQFRDQAKAQKIEGIELNALLLNYVARQTREAIQDEPEYLVHGEILRGTLEHSLRMRARVLPKEPA